MAADDYLQNCRKRWTPLPDAELDGLSDEHKEVVRQWEEFCLNGEFAALTDIILNCTDKFQFAKTYKVLREDYRRTFANPNLANPKFAAFPPEVNRLICKTGMSTIERKLDNMAMWFYIKWSDHQQISIVEYKKAIEGYTNSGCPLGVLLFFLPWATALGGAYLILSIVLK